jgi:hypothetical protein
MVQGFIIFLRVSTLQAEKVLKPRPKEILNLGTFGQKISFVENNIYSAANLTKLFLCSLHFCVIS